MLIGKLYSGAILLQVYERAIPAVPKAERMSVVELYVSRATDFFGVAKVSTTLCLRGPSSWHEPCAGRVGVRKPPR